ncbi:MAG: BamA/TamA family outer membrane protein [Casimicrobiaceae bacterium]
MLALLLACASSSSLAALADPPPAAGATAPAPEGDANYYRVVVEAPKEVADLLRLSVGLVRWQSYADMTDDLLDRLVREAASQAREAISTVGYFMPEVDIDVDRSTTPITVTLRVVLGNPVRIHDVQIDVSGPAARDDAQGAAAIAQMRREWGLPQGTIFNQTTWDRAKLRAVQTLAASPYAAAALTSSEARIDPQSREADLAVGIASGPPFRVGTIDVTGLSRYSVELVRNFSTQKRGDLYSGAELDQFVRRLNGSGYFASVQAVIDADPANADDATLRTSVIEAPTKKFEGGIGFSTDTKIRVNASYRDVDVDGRATQFLASGRLETNQQSALLRFIRPPTAGGWIDSVGLHYDRTDLNNLRTKTVGASVRRASIEDRNQWQFGAAFLDARQEPEGGETSTAHALYVDAEHTWRRVDNLVAPTSGWILDLQGGAGVPGVSTRGFGRAVARFAAWYPLNADWELSGKAEAGAVFGAKRQDVPSTLLFRTGGDTTVRGYAFDSLGVKDGAATVPGRYYLLGSVEATRWINATLGIATFVDAGNAFDSLSDSSIALGYGVGARVRTPIGPFRFDVAYGQDSRQIRVHFSVGLAF